MCTPEDIYAAAIVILDLEDWEAALFREVGLGPSIFLIFQHLSMFLVQ